MPHTEKNAVYMCPALNLSHEVFHLFCVLLFYTALCMWDIFFMMCT